MADDVSETSTRSWGSRIKDAFFAVLVGLILIIGAVVLIFWNEKHSLHLAQSLEQAQKALVAVPNSPINSENNQKVVYFTGLATTDEDLSDSSLGVTVNAINLDRKVEMYQWEEHKKTEKKSRLGGGEEDVTTYTYSKVWADHLIDSSNFKKQEGHKNPATMPVEPKTQYAENVFVGDFYLPSELIQQINVSKPIVLTDANRDQLKTKLNKPITLINDQLYVGQDPQHPQLDDLKINLSAVYPQNVSVIGQQADDTVQPFLAPAGESIMMLSVGTISSMQMIHDALAENNKMTWIWRGASLVMLIVGFSLLFRPIVVFSDFLPFLGSIMGFSLGFVGLILGLGVWLIATSIAWFATRPVLSLSIIGISVMFVLLAFKMKKKSALVR